jgi:hypothetical protein
MQPDGKKNYYLLTLARVRVGDLAAKTAIEGNRWMKTRSIK